MSPATRRVILRWIHIVLAMPVAGYIYTPFDALEGFAPLVRWVILPLMVVTGLWMWKGHVLRRLFAGQAAGR